MVRGIITSKNAGNVIPDDSQGGREAFSFESKHSSFLSSFQILDKNPKPS
jgi:hypothetical protein